MYDIVICDDTEIDLLRLKQYIEKSPEFDSSSMNIHTFTSGIAYLDDMTEKTDLLMLDMQMELMSGFETAVEMRRKNATAVLCFCSAVITPQAEHFEVQPYRYIIKTSDDAKIKRTVDELLVEMKRRGHQKTIEIVSDGIASLIPVNDILYLEKARHGTLVMLSSSSSLYSGNGKLVSREKLKELEEQLKDDGFAMPHTSYLVNVRRIVSVTTNNLILEDKEVIAISRSCKESFHHEFSKYFNKKYKRN